MKKAAVVANLSILLTFVAAALLSAYNEPLYYLSVQEDEYLEWATFWGFVVAGGIFFVNAYQEFKVRRHLPWFVFGQSAVLLRRPWNHRRGSSTKTSS